MESDMIPPLPAKNFVFPVLRPLVTMIKCRKAVARIEDSAAPPVVLKRESLSNAGFLAEALSMLSETAEIDTSELKAITTTLKNPALWRGHPVDPAVFTLLVKTVESFSIAHKSALSKAYRRDKDVFCELYRKRVLKRRVLVIHSPNDSPDVLMKNLTSGCYYEADAVAVDKAKERSAKHHVTVFLCTNTREAAEFFMRLNRVKPDIFLSNLGRELPALNMNLCRTINQAQRSGMKFIPPPYVTMKLLPAVEECYVRHLEAFDRTLSAQEDAMMREETELFEGMAEAELYAELIVKSHWVKTAGFAAEKSFLNAGN